MAPIVYRKTSVLNWQDWAFLCSLGWLIIAVGWLILAVLSYSRNSLWELGVWADVVRYGYVIIVPINFVVAAGFFRMALPRHNQLQLDDVGLTYKRAGQRGAWPWRDISAFTLARGWRGPCIEFTVSGDDGRWRIAPLRRTKAGLTGTIPNIWDTPVEDIAATLNQYRERALVGANGPPAPEQA